jgi:hypothetical protein
LGQAFGAAYLARGLPEQVSFWTTPYGGATADAGPPFDIAAFALRVPADTASHISSSPCVIPPDTNACSATIRWNTAAQSATAAVWVDAGSGRPTLVACGKEGQTIAPWVQPDTAYTFSLYATPACGGSATEVTGVRVASVLVTATTAQGGISATPNPCKSGSNSTCAAVISWQAAVSSGTARVFVARGNEAPRLFACGPAGQQHASWIQLGEQFTFTLYAASSCASDLPQTAPLARVAVTAQ